MMLNKKMPVILTIDDEKNIRVSFRHYLEDFDYKVIEAEDGNKGLEIFSRESPDLVLVDLRLPGKDGLDVLAFIREDSPDVPVIIVSGTEMIGDAIEALQLGAWDYLLKPMEDLSVLKHAVEKALERARLIRDNRAYQENLEFLVAKRTEELERANADLSSINRRLHRIVETTKGISLCQQISQFGSRLLEEFGQQMKAVGGSLYLIEDKGMQLIHALDPGHAPNFIPFPLKSNSIFKKTMDHGDPLLIPNVEKFSDFSSSGWAGYKDGSVLVFPLYDEDKNIEGLLSLHSKTSPPFLEQDKEIGSILASYSCEALRATRAVESLQESEERLRAILDSLQTGIVIINPETHIVVDVNPAAIELIGAEKEMIVGKICHEFLCPEKEGLCPITDENKRIDRMERILVTADGDRLPIIKTVTSVILNGKNHLLESFIDISARKRAEKEQIRLTTAIDQAAEAFTVVDLEGIIEYVNPAFERITGYSRETTVGRNIKKLWTHSQNSIFQTEAKEAVQKGNIWQGKLDYRTKQGAISRAEVTVSPVRDASGAIVSIVSVMRDVTREEQLEVKLRQAQKMEAIGTLAGGIAHDFNNILSAIIGFTEITGFQIDQNKPVKGTLKKTLNAAERAKGLISQILSFSRQTEQERQPMKVSPIIKEVLKLLRASLPSTIEIRSRLEMEKDTIDADSTQIHQVLMNLCTNAHHAMRKKGGVLDIDLASVEMDDNNVSAYPDLRPGSYLQLTVADTGDGMDEKTLEQIFDPYFTTKEKGEGTGLGLSVVHGIVKSHGGTITVESRLGKGTSFYIYLPRIDMEKKEDEPMFSQTLPRGSERILFVDDEDTLVDIGKEMLEYLGYEVLTKTNSSEALRLFRSQPDAFDLVITDMTMPKMTGDLFAKELMKIRPDIPVILCTGYSEVITTEVAKSIGIKDLLMKPLTVNDIAVTLRKNLDP